MRGDCRRRPDVQIHPIVRIPLLLLAGMALGAGLLALAAGVSSGEWGLVWRGAAGAGIGVAAIMLARRARTP